MSTSMSAEQASSGAMPWTSTVSRLPERRDDVGSDALGLKWESDFVIEVVIPPHDLLFRPISVHDGFVVNSVLSDGVSLGFLHAVRMDAATKCYNARVAFCRLAKTF